MGGERGCLVEFGRQSVGLGTSSVNYVLVV